MLSDEETAGLKKKLFSHIETNFPPEQILSAKSQIESMNSEQLEIFLEKNNIMIPDKNENVECVFCAIASDKIKSVKIDENEKAIAVFEINPISKGHCIIIPKEHSDIISKEAMSLTEKISKKIKEKFSPKNIEMSESKLFGHAIVNILPVYKDENFNSEKYHMTLEELEKIKEELASDFAELRDELCKRSREEKEETIKKEIESVEKIKEFFRLPKRIP